MLSFLILIIAISFPIFWLYGFICFLRNIFSSRPKNESNESLLIEIVKDLNEAKSKKTNVNSLLAKYKNKLGLVPQEIPASVPSPSLANQSEIVSTTPQKESVLTQDIGSWWDRWYEENNINLLLYIGAFLIVSSAAIFVGFNWETLSGSLKAVVLDVITLAFFGAGFYFYLATPKLKNASSTFLAIGSLLIPFNGLAWYNFSLREAGFSFGQVWVFTSLIALLVYFWLAFFIRNSFYTYIAGLGSLSLVEALVNISALDSQYYILGGIFSSFALLGGSQIISKINKENFESVFGQPLRVSAHIVMPIFLSWGLLVAYSTNRLFTPQASISTILAAGYYFLAYIVNPNIAFFSLGELILMLGVVLLAKTNYVRGVWVFYIILIVSFLYQIGSFIFKEFNKKLESYYSNVVAIYSSLLGLGIAFVDQLVTAKERVYLLLIFGGLNLFANLISSSVYFLYLTIGTLDLAPLLWITTVWERTDLFNYLGIFYLIFGIALYFAGQSTWKTKNSLSTVLLVSAAINFFGALVFTLSSPGYSLIVSCAIIITLLWASYYFQKVDLAYGAVLFAALAVLNLLRLSDASLNYYPLAFTALGIGTYLLHLSPLPYDYKTVFKNASISITVASPIVFGIYSFNNYATTNTLEMNSLISAYGATGLLTFEALNFQDGAVGYGASVAALLTILWQYNYLHISEFQVYAITTGLYFLGLSYLKRGQKQLDLQNTFDYIGLGILLVPLTLQAFPQDSFSYALLLGTEGVLLLIAGFSLSHKNYIYAGAAGIVLATLTRLISVISSLPSWLTVGIGGLIFLVVAIYLLSKREEKG